MIKYLSYYYDGGDSENHKNNDVGSDVENKVVKTIAASMLQNNTDSSNNEDKSYFINVGKADPVTNSH